MKKLTLPVTNGPGRGFLCPRYDGWFLLPVILYLIFVLPVYVENNAGSGLNLPQNLLSWWIIVLYTLLIAGRSIATGRLYIAKFMLPAILAALLLMLPWLWTTSSLWQHHALPRLAGIVGALMFTLALSQINMAGGLRRIVLKVVVFSALVQAVEAMVQAWLPGIALHLMDYDAISPYGIFQQRNLLATWLATGYGVALYLAWTSRNRAGSLGWVMTLYPLSTAIVLTQSRIGVLAAIVMTALNVLAVLPGLRQRPLAILRRVMLLLSLVAWCSAISQWAMPSGQQADFSHPASTEQRIRVLAGTATMIAQHPLTGSGLGSFESLFPQALEATGLQSLENDTFTHPHNEVMYVIAEGGIVALTGLFLLAWCWLWPVARHLSRRNGRWLLSLSGLPVVMHMMTEYPLYLSTPHLILLLLLFRAGMPDDAFHRFRIPILLRASILPALCMATIAVLIVLTAGFSVQMALTQAEADMKGGLIPELPTEDWRSLTQQERLDYDQHMLTANAPGFVHNSQAMSSFTVWGNRWLAVHNDAEVSAAMLFISSYRGDFAESKRLRAQAARVFVRDARFFKEIG